MQITSAHVRRLCALVIAAWIVVFVPVAAAQQSARFMVVEGGFDEEADDVIELAKEQGEEESSSSSSSAGTGGDTGTTQAAVPAQSGGGSGKKAASRAAAAAKQQGTTAKAKKSAPSANKAAAPAAPAGKAAGTSIAPKSGAQQPPARVTNYRTRGLKIEAVPVRRGMLRLSPANAGFDEVDAATRKPAQNLTRKRRSPLLGAVAAICTPEEGECFDKAIKLTAVLGLLYLGWEVRNCHAILTRNTARKSVPPRKRR